MYNAQVSFFSVFSRRHGDFPSSSSTIMTITGFTEN
jgi:hypothetical protein